MLIVAARPGDDEWRVRAVRSHLECMVEHNERIGKVIIAAPRNATVMGTLRRLADHARGALPAAASRLEVRHYDNDRYDAGLWCDALLRGGVLKRDGDNPPYLNNSSSDAFDRFVLINDSLLAMDETTIHPDFDAVYSQSKAGAYDLISLNYWGDPETKDLFHEDRRKRYWLESPLRSFSLRGIQIFADEVCSLPAVEVSNLMTVCPDKRVTSRRDAWKRIKRCIVEKTEIDVARYIGNGDRVHGLYPGGVRTPNGRAIHWSHRYPYWAKELREGRRFPFGKVSAELWPCMESRHRDEARFCVRNYEWFANRTTPALPSDEAC